MGDCTGVRDEYHEGTVMLPGGHDVNVRLYSCFFRPPAAGGGTRWCRDTPWECEIGRTLCARVHYGTPDADSALSEAQFLEAFLVVEQQLAKGRGDQVHALRWLCSSFASHTEGVGTTKRWTGFSVDLQIKRRGFVGCDIFEIRYPSWNVWVEQHFIESGALKESFWVRPGLEYPAGRFTAGESLEAMCEDTKGCTRSAAPLSNTMERIVFGEMVERCVQEDLLAQYAEGRLP
jgi:hypothetical protein